MHIENEIFDKGTEGYVTKRVKEDLEGQLYGEKWTVQAGEYKVHGSVGRADVVVWKGMPKAYGNLMLVAECKGKENHRAAVGDAIIWAHNIRQEARAGVALYEPKKRVKNAIKDLPLFGWDISAKKENRLFTKPDNGSIEELQDRLVKINRNISSHANYKFNEDTSQFVGDRQR